MESANASLAEMFAPSAKTLAHAGQAGTENADAENNFYSPSLLGFTQNNSYSFSSFYIATDFNSINNVLIKSSLNSSTTEYGNVDTNYDPVTMGSFHASFPLFKKRLKTKLGLSVYFPTDKLTQTSSGDFWTPEYVFYRARYIRTGFAFNVIQPFFVNGKVDWTISFGINGSFQTTGETYMIANGFGDTEPTSGKLKFDVRPQASPVISYTKVLPEKMGLLSASYHHKIENKLSTDASGYTPINNTSNIPFDVTLKSLLYFDPSIMRVNWIKQWNTLTFNTTLEYQIWSDYRTPKIEIVSRTGFNSSVDYEKMTTKDILIPKASITWQFIPTTSVTAGAFYRQSPLENNLNNAGNSIDADTTVLSLGASHRINFLEEQFTLHAAYQHQILESTNVVKTANMENGSAGSKIGSPGYSVGGTVQIVSFGVNWEI